MKKKISNEQIKNVKGKIFKDKTNQLINSDRPTKYFFIKYKKKMGKNYIRCLKDSNGILKYDISDMLKIVEDYYNDLYHPNEIRDSVVNFFLNEVNPINSNIDMSILTEPISIEELKNVVKSFPNNKSPGPDGLTGEFYKIAFPI